MAGECLTDAYTTLPPFDRTPHRLRIVDCAQTHLLEVAFVGAFTGTVSPTEPPALDGPERRAAYRLRRLGRCSRDRAVRRLIGGNADLVAYAFGVRGGQHCFQQARESGMQVIAA